MYNNSNSEFCSGFKFADEPPNFVSHPCLCTVWQVERQSGDIDLWREKYKTLETSMQAKMEALER